VRENLAWILSCYKHYLKYGGTMKLEEWFSLDGSGVMSSDDFMIYPRLLKLKKYYGENVYIYDLDNLIKEPQIVVNEIAAFVGVNYKGDYLFNIENEGVCKRRAGILRLINIFVQRFKMLDRFRLTGVINYIIKLIPNSNYNVRFKDEDSKIIKLLFEYDRKMVREMVEGKGGL
jgi:hypothetical protein